MFFQLTKRISPCQTYLSHSSVALPGRGALRDSGPSGCFCGIIFEYGYICGHQTEKFWHKPLTTMQDAGTRFPIKWHLMLKYIRNNQKFKKHAEYHEQLNFWHIDDIGIISSIKVGKGRVGEGTLFICYSAGTFLHSLLGILRTQSGTRRYAKQYLLIARIEKF